jgi:hypothetical protein
VTTSSQARRRGALAAELMSAAVLGRAPRPIAPEELAGISRILLRSGAAPMAWWALRGSPLDGDETVEEFRDSYRLELLRAELAEGELAGLFEALHAGGLDPVLGKGWAVSRFYPSPGLRPYGDFDLYVPPDDFRRLNASLSAQKTTRRFEVDAHRGWSYLDDRDPADLLLRTRQLPLRSTVVRVFGMEDQLRLACLHACAEGLIRPTWLCDVAFLTSAAGADFDWDYFSRGSPRRTEWCFATIGLASDLLGIDITDVPGMERRRPLPRWFGRSVLEAWGREPRPRGVRTPMENVRRTPRAMVEALLARWPEPIEATVGVGGRIHGAPRFPYKVADGAMRLMRHVRAAWRRHR